MVNSYVAHIQCSVCASHTLPLVTRHVYSFACHVMTSLCNSDAVCKPDHQCYSDATCIQDTNGKFLCSAHTMLCVRFTHITPGH